MPSPSWHPLDDPSSELIESNWLFDLRREPFRSGTSGQVHQYYVIYLADAVNVVALTPDRKLVLVRQFRAGSRLDSLETPGGLVDEGEDVLSASVRELREETGYEGDPPIVLGTVWSNPSILSSRIATVLVTNARVTTRPSLDVGEEVHVELIPSGRVPHMIRDGRINHALVVQGLLLWLVSELPDTPFATSVSEWKGSQYHLRGLMITIAIFAGLFGLIANMGMGSSIALMFACALAFGPYAVVQHLDPPSKAILLRTRKLRTRVLILRLLACLGLGLVIFLSAWLAFALVNWL